MPVDKAKQYARQEAWRKKNAKLFSFRLLTSTDADLIAHLEAQPNKQGYIKALIRADMERTRGETTQNETENPEAE